jgi:hypothetical protein
MNTSTGKPLELNSLELSVIDCTTRSLVLLPEKNPYVTLSYVWGGPETAQDGR